jgi:hypothetical protein
MKKEARERDTTRELRNEKLQNLYILIRDGTNYVSHVREVRDAYKIVIGNPR